MSTQTLSPYAFVSQLPADTEITFDGNTLAIHLLEQGGYQEAEFSRALPMLTAEVPTRFLTRLRADGDTKVLRAFDEWLQSTRS